MRCVPWLISRPGACGEAETGAEAAAAGDAAHARDCCSELGGSHVAHEHLLAAKRRIEEHKLTHGVDAWVRAVRRMDTRPPRGTTRAPASRAYHKLVELIETCVIPTPRIALHLCEAPGGFVQAVLEKYPSVQGAYMHSLMCDGAPFFAPALLHDPKVLLVRALHGDITSAEVRAKIVADVEAHAVDLVTADGAVDSDMRPESTEQNNSTLLASQIDVALAAQKTGGTFVVKVFGMVLFETLASIAHLCMCYDSVYATKPVSSRPTNDERYLVCMGFRGACARPSTLPRAWCAEVQERSAAFARSQCVAIERALRLLHDDETVRAAKQRGGKTRGRWG